MTINAEGNLAAGLLAEAAHIDDPDLLQPLREKFRAAAAAVSTGLRDLPESAEKDVLRRASATLLALGTAKDNIFEVRERELRTFAVTRRSLEVKREQISAALKSAHAALLQRLTPMVDDAVFDLVIDSEKATEVGSRSINDLINVGVSRLQLLLTLRAEGNLIAGILNESAGKLDETLLLPLQERFVASAGSIDRILREAPSSQAYRPLRETMTALIRFGRAGAGIIDLRRGELRQIARAQDSLESSRALLLMLSREVAELVTAARRESDAAAVKSANTIESGKIFMILITAVSILGAALVAMYYVRPRIVRPLEHITDAMTELAAGDTSVDIPGRERTDEMGRMAQALGVFRDTAIEVQESNLREIREARRRLTDAIESISEGFSLYDENDRLVVCNSTYRTLLYPDIADEIVPGMSFESLARRSAEGGYVEDAKGRIDEWLAERLDQHHNPKGPMVQHRGDGQWILVSERRTEDDGTVGVYSDITELKQRERELADKSNALEMLSNQLAKYLSPQVYESIFTGKQEVKIASQRKKLTVFFSDIAGFTETTDRMESEDLTELLNHYLTEMSQIALAHGATIDKYVGDAIVIFFGDPESRGVTDDALACVDMAIAMRARMRELQGVWRSSGIEQPLHCRMGINTGYCTVGNFGSDDRMDYTIIGGDVNLAARLESAAESDEILISYETFAHVKDRIQCEERGQISVKGIAYPVATYQVIDSFDALGLDRLLIREEQPNLKLDLDVDAMSLDERESAEKILRSALDKVSNFSGGARTRAED
jgi:class 3 adenylate cyclase/HAMP domain-containing protein